MTNVWRKLNDQWVIFVTDMNVKDGDEVLVTKASGQTSNVRLGALVQAHGTFKLFSVAKKGAPVLSSPGGQNIGNLSNINNLFAVARSHLKWPKVALGTPNDARGVRITVAGPKSKVPGSLTLTSLLKNYDGTREWYGRVNPDGTFDATNSSPASLLDVLKDFAADPVKVASAHGHLTGNCCFCSLSLTDERSTAVGYGKVCADHFGLPWGARPVEFAAAA